MNIYRPILNCFHDYAAVLDNSEGRAYKWIAREEFIKTIDLKSMKSFE